MANAAVLESSSEKDFPFRKPGAKVNMKRKTPSQLRGEQLKRTISEKLTDNESQPPKLPKYKNIRVSEVYPVKKSSEICRLLYGKEKLKDLSNISEKGSNFGQTDTGSSFPCGDGGVSSNTEYTDQSYKNNHNNTERTFRKIEKCSQSALRSVVQLHIGDEKSQDSTKIDMEKALKGLCALRDIPLAREPSGKFCEIPSNSTDNCPSEIHVPGNKAPLDLTLKTNLRFVLSSSVKWCHRISAACANNATSIGHSCTCKVSPTFSREENFSRALCSFVYPQCTLPPSVISVLASSAAKGEMDFLQRRQQEWEDSLQNLYYMLRKNLCSIFYVYTSQFVALFVGGNFSGKKQTCNAFLSQSTRGLRSLLRKNGINFSMPLCHAESAEQVSEDDLVELSEIEKRNLGQALHLDSFADVDNSTQSLLSFTGSESVHGLYDFLLNYRFILSSLRGGDVPLLYSPVPFQNACLHFPEVRSKEMRRADMVGPTDSGENNNYITGNMCYSIEINDTVIPPWVVTGICAAISLDGKNFDSIFTTDPLSMGLNIAVNSNSIKSDSNEPPSERLNNTFGITNTVSVPCLNSASIRRLKYSDSAYVAYTDS